MVFLENTLDVPEEIYLEVSGKFFIRTMYTDFNLSLKTRLF